MEVGLEAAASANLLLDHRLDPALHKEQKPKQLEIRSASNEVSPSGFQPLAFIRFGLLS